MDTTYKILEDMGSLIENLSTTALDCNLWREDGEIQRELDVMTVRINRALKNNIDPVARTVRLIEERLSHLGENSSPKIEAIKILRQSEVCKPLFQAGIFPPYEMQGTMEKPSVGLGFAKEWVEKNLPSLFKNK